MISRSKELIKEYKQQKAQLRQDLAIMENKLKVDISDNLKTVKPEQEEKLKLLRGNIESETAENLHLKMQITEMLKKNTELEKTVMKYEAKINQLELIIGK